MSTTKRRGQPRLEQHFDIGQCFADMRSGDRERANQALSKIIDQRNKSVYGAAKRRAEYKGSNICIEDVVHDFWFELYETVQRAPHNTGSAGAFFYSTLKFYLGRKFRDHPELLTDTEFDVNLMQDPSDPEGDIDLEDFRLRVVRPILEILSRNEPLSTAILRLRFNDVSHRRIAEILNLKKSTVGYYVEKVLRHTRLCIAEDDLDSFGVYINSDGDMRDRATNDVGADVVVDMRRGLAGMTTGQIIEMVKSDLDEDGHLKAYPQAHELVATPN